MTPDVPLNARAVADQVAGAFVHRLFPDLRPPAFLACPDDRCSDTCRVAIAEAAKKNHVKTEVLDLRSHPAARLDQVTAGLRDVSDRPNDDRSLWPTLLVVDGFDLLEGSKNDAPTYPFRSRFQFDQKHLWLFVGRDWQGLRKMFGNRLYRAATDITPEPWRVVPNAMKGATPEAP